MCLYIKYFYLIKKNFNYSLKINLIKYIHNTKLRIVIDDIKSCPIEIINKLYQMNLIYIDFKFEEYNYVCHMTLALNAAIRN